VQPAFDDNLADENHNSVYRDYHYQRLNMGSAPGLRSMQPGYAFPYETQAKRRTGAPDVPRPKFHETRKGILLIFEGIARNSPRGYWEHPN
jgi:hypothetical protein